MATVLRRDLAKPAGLERAAFQDAERPRPLIAEDRNPVRGKAPTVARWGYQLCGGRVVPAEVVGQMPAGEGEYGLGTMLFSL
jgi:hypothetical protein